jgi:hypothetical protein
MISQCSHCGCEIKPDTRPLNEIMEFDHPVQIGPDGTVTDHVPGVYAPELVMETDDDGQILDGHEADYTEQARQRGWELLTGWTGQYGYRGLVMHPSEYLGGALADHIRETPGTYVVLAVECDQDSDPAGWAVARRIEPDPAPYAENTPEYRVWKVAQEKGKNAASWVVDGNTSKVSARGLVKGIEDGDPAVMDSIREPSLSGEFGGDYSEDQLMADVGYVPHDGTLHRDDLAEQYSREARESFWHEVERLARAALDG